MSASAEGCIILWCQTVRECNLLKSDDAILHHSSFLLLLRSMSECLDRDTSECQVSPFVKKPENSVFSNRKLTLSHLSNTFNSC